MAAAPNDMPLDKGDVGTRFVMLVVIMMTALATIALGGALIVGALRSTWVDAVTGNITIEIPASDGKGVVRTADTLAQEATAIAAVLQKTKGVTSVHVLSHADVEALVKPWLGSDAGSDDLPLPALLGVTIHNPDDKGVMADIANNVATTDAAAIVETHQTWVRDLRRFSLVLLLAAGAMASITIACCILSVAGAVQSRLSAHQGDIDLLHLMGATDHYIGSQFVRIVVKAVGTSALAGTGIGLALLKTGALIAGEIQSAVLPAHAWGFVDFLWFAALPALVTALCYGAARVTVLRSLRVMP